MIKKIVCIFFSIFSLAACNDQTTQLKKEEIIETIQKTFYLEQKLKGNNVTNFWELNIHKQNINIRSGTVGTEGEIHKTEFVSEIIARYEAYKLIKQKNKEGFHSPNLISLETLLANKSTDIKDIDKSLYSPLQGDHYSRFILVNGDVHIDRLDIDAYHSLVDGVIINGNLIVEGGIYNAEGDYGPALIVTGDVTADYVIGGGSEIYLQGQSYIHGFIIGHYNHGILLLEKTTAMVSMDSDHYMGTGKDSNVTYDYDIFKDEEDLEKLKNAFGKSSGFIEDDENFNHDELIKVLITNDGESIKLLGKILDANHADNPLLVQVIEDGLLIKTIENPTEAMKIAAVTQTAHAYEFINNPSEKVKLATVGESSWGLELIKNPSDAVIKHAIKSFGSAIQFVKNPSETLQKLAVKDEGSAIQYIENPSETTQLAAVQQYGDSIEHIEIPSETVQLTAVKEDGYALRYIKNPSYKVQLVAVKNSGSIIGMIKNPSDELIHAAITNDPDSIEYIQSPSEAVQKMAVEKNGSALKYIKNPSYEVQLIAVKEYGDAIEYIKNPNEELMLEAAKNSPGAIEFIENPSEEVQLIAIEKNPYLINYIQDPSEELQLKAVTYRGSFIEYIKNPNETVQLAAIRKDPIKAITLIKNPTVKAIALAKELSNK